MNFEWLPVFHWGPDDLIEWVLFIGARNHVPVGTSILNAFEYEIETGARLLVGLLSLPRLL